MNINLNNYESFFLLYVDNELSAAERKSVEEFLGNYPYLQQELDQLKDTVLPVEENTFTFKAGLLKPVMTEETLQENLLLHLDNELAGEQKQHLESLLLKDNELQKEWALLKRTKLDAAELVAFPDKTMLHRHESGRLVIGRFSRWAVAAALIGAGIFAGLNLVKNDNGTSPSVATIPGKPSGTVTPPTGIASAKIEKKEEKSVPGIQPAVRTMREDEQPAKNRSNQYTGSKQDENIAATRPKNPSPEKPVVSNERERMMPKSVSGNQELARIDQPENNEGRNGMTIASVKNKPAMLTDINIQPVENLFARNASFENDENSDDHIFMMDEDKVSRTKAAGFLKKIKRTVERTTKIKPGNSLRIAGFEFAVK